MSGKAEAISRPIRVLHLRDSPWVDGPGRTILETAARIDRTRVDYQVGVFVPEASEPHPLVDALRWRNLPVHVIVDQGGVGPDMVRRIVKLLDRLQIDVLHTSEFRSNALGLLCRRRRPVRLVSTAHGWIANDLRGHLYTWADRVLLRQVDRVVLVSQAMRHRLPSWWIPDSRVLVLQNALATDTYGRWVHDVIRRVPDPATDVRLLNVGRLSPEKGQILLLRAFAALVQDYPGLSLSFAGVGPLQPELESLVKRLGIASRVRFLGYVADMPRLYAETDLVVQSSFTEGLPNVLLETAYLGVPVVATDVGGTAEVIQHGTSGWLIRPRSLDSLVAGLRAFLQEPGKFAVLARTGRSRIETSFSFDTRTKRQEVLYQELACGAP